MERGREEQKITPTPIVVVGSSSSGYICDYINGNHLKMQPFNHLVFNGCNAKWRGTILEFMIALIKKGGGLQFCFFDQAVFFLLLKMTPQGIVFLPP